MVIVQFHGRLVRQYKACIVDSLVLGITSYINVLCVQRIPCTIVSFDFYVIPILIYIYL